MQRKDKRWNAAGNDTRGDEERIRECVCWKGEVFFFLEKHDVFMVHTESLAKEKTR